MEDFSFDYIFKNNVGTLVRTSDRSNKDRIVKVFLIKN